MDSGGASAGKEVSAYVRDFLCDEKWRADPSTNTWDKLASGLGVRKSTLMNIKKGGRGATGSRGVGIKVERGFAALYHAGSVDALRVVAEAYYQEHYGETTQTADAYPNRAEAIDRLGGLLNGIVVDRLRQQSSDKAQGRSVVEWIHEALVALRGYEQEQEAASRLSAIDVAPKVPVLKEGDASRASAMVLAHRRRSKKREAEG